MKNRGLNPLEEAECLVFAEWLRLKKYLYLHIPNEGLRHPATGKRLRRIGLSRGAPDYLIFETFGTSYRGIAIEMKRRRGGRVTPYQREWLEALESRGWLVKVCRGADEAIRFVEGLKQQDEGGY